MDTMRGTDAHGHGSLQNVDVAHEHSDINIRAVIWFAVGLIITAALVEVAMWAMMVALDKVEVRSDPYVTPMAIPAGTLPPEPRLQETPRLDLKMFRESEKQYLESYGWIDQKADVAHVPIEKAKELILQRGLPSRPTAAEPREGTHVASDGESSGGRSISAGGADRSAPAAKGPGGQ